MFIPDLERMRGRTGGLLDEKDAMKAKAKLEETF